MDKTVAIEVAKLRDLYQRSDKKTRTALEGLCGKDVLVRNGEELWEVVKEHLLNGTAPSTQEAEGAVEYVESLRNVECPKVKPWIVKDESGKPTGIGIPIIKKVLALHDLNDGEEMNWDDAMSAAKEIGKTLPTRDDWYIIRYFKDDIQRLMKEAGGDPLQDNYYWSSTESNTGRAWAVTFYYGCVFTGYKYGTYGTNSVVRPVAAL